MPALPDTRMPGVITQEIPTLPPSIALVPSAVPVFIGYTEKAEKAAPNDLLNKATRVRNLDEYEKWFGTAPVQELDVEVDDRSALGEGFKVKVSTKANTTFYRMHYAMQMYYANGGGPAYIISMGDGKTPPAAPKTVNDLYTTAINAAKKAKDITIIVLPDAVNLNADNYNKVTTAALQHCKAMINRVTLIDVTILNEADKENNDQITALFRSKVSSIPDEKKYGIAYYPYLKTTLSYNFAADKVNITKMTKNGKIIEQIISQAIDAAITADAAILVLDLEKKAKTAAGADSFPKALEDEFKKDGVTTAAIKAKAKELSDAATALKKLNTLENSDNLAYNQILNAIRNAPVEMPPSPAIAGLYVANDFSQGVWNAPANVSLAGVVGPTVDIDDDLHAQLNVDASSGKSINAIRTYLGKGTLVFGARTLAGNDLEWRYVNVRRTFCFIEDSIARAMQDFVFSPNSRATWIKVKAMIGNFLNEIWKAGGLFGDTPADAYRIEVGVPESMTEVDILEGRMIVNIKIAVVRPAEFIILRYEHKFNATNN